MPQDSKASAEKGNVLQAKSDSKIPTKVETKERKVEKTVEKTVESSSPVKAESVDHSEKERSTLYGEVIDGVRWKKEKRDFVELRDVGIQCNGVTDVAVQVIG